MTGRPLLCTLLLGACAADYAGSSLSDAGSFGGGPSDAPSAPQCLSSNECPTGYQCNDFGQCVAPPPPTIDGGTPPPPPEVEYEFGAPIASDRFVYVAMTDEDALARIDGRDLSVRSTGVGRAPRIVSAIPHEDGAVVLDSFTGTATIVRPPAVSTAPDRVVVLPTLPDLNRLDIDPSGRFAVIWFDLQKAIADAGSSQGGVSGIGSFQDVTIVALADGAPKAVDLTVGFRPRSVQFDAAGDRAYVITEDGVSVIDLANATQHGPAIVPPIAVADPSIAVADLEVQIVATGEYATVRQAGVAALRIVDVAGANAGAVTTVPLASPPTDIDLAPDGAHVYAVERDAKKLAAIAIPSGATTQIDLSSGTVGSLALSADGRRALVYTNATIDERITMIALDNPAFPVVTWPLKKSVRAVGISPTGDTAIVLNAKIAGDPAHATSVDDYIDKSYGYTLLDLASGFGKLQITPVDPSAFVYAPDGSKAYVALDGGDSASATRELQVVTTATGVVITKPLGSPPSAVGILPGANEAFVAQRHPLGRVSFVELVADTVRTVTGFDLNGDVVE